MKTIISRHYISALAIASVMTAGLASCSDAEAPIQKLTELIPPSTVTLEFSDAAQERFYTDYTGVQVLPMIVGDSYQIGYSITPAVAADWQMLWQSSNPEVATIDNGTLTAVGSTGDANSTITLIPYGIQSGQGPSQSFKVFVDDRLHQATDFDIVLSANEAYEGDNITASVNITPDNATFHSVHWSTSNQTLATVDLKGKVTAGTIPSGTTATVDIIGTSLDGTGLTKSKTFTVKKKVAPTSVTIDQTYQGRACAIGDYTLALPYTTSPTDATKSMLRWTTSDESLATVDNGVVTFNTKGKSGTVRITATCPDGTTSSSVDLNLAAGFLRELYHNENLYSLYDAQQSGNGTSTKTEWHDGHLTITTYTQDAAATKQRADLKWHTNVCTPVLHAGNYPIIAIKMDDVKDLYKTEGVTARNINADFVGTSESGKSYKALGNGNNKYTSDLKCSDNSHVFIYDMSTLAFGTGGLAPTNESITFTTLQFKYADIATISKQITYNVYWLQTFKTVQDVKDYIQNVDHLTYTVIK